MIPGNAVFFKTSQDSAGRKAVKVQYKGYGYGIFLGHVPPFQKDPPVLVLRRQMGAIGYLTFDDVADFLGDESAAKCVATFEAKYYAPEVVTEPANEVPKDPNDGNLYPPGQSEAESKLLKPPIKKLVGLDGKEIDPSTMMGDPVP